MKNWYDLPTYYDVSFSHEMSEELAFLKAVFSRYCNSRHPKLLEPACGTGRLMIPLIRAGYDCTGFDLNELALDFLRERLKRNRLKANIFNGNMEKFHVKANTFDTAFCTVDTFRHLLTENQAEQHLVRVGKALKKEGLYVLGLHLVPDTGLSNKVTCWTAKRGRLTVKTTMTMIKMDKKKRMETLKVVLKPITIRKNESHTSVYQLRTYTFKQLKKILDKISIFEIVNAYDEFYDISSPATINSKSEYVVLLLRKR